MNEPCPVMVIPQEMGMSGDTCGRPVKRNGMCGIHARSADLAQLRSEAVQDLKNDLHRICMQLPVLNVKCTTDGNKVILTDPEGLIRQMRTVQIMTDAR